MVSIVVASMKHEAILKERKELNRINNIFVILISNLAYRQGIYFMPAQELVCINLNQSPTCGSFS
jgi:hypothetical protein